MSSAYFAPLVTLPDIITAPGSYRTRAGEKVEVERAPSGYRQHAFDCLGAYPNGIRERWHRSGRVYATSECRNDIVRKTEAPVSEPPQEQQ